MLSREGKPCSSTSPTVVFTSTSKAPVNHNVTSDHTSDPVLFEGTIGGLTDVRRENLSRFGCTLTVIGTAFNFDQAWDQVVIIKNPLKNPLMTMISDVSMSCPLLKVPDDSSVNPVEQRRRLDRCKVYDEELKQLTENLVNDIAPSHSQVISNSRVKREPMTVTVLAVAALFAAIGAGGTALYMQSEVSDLKVKYNQLNEDLIRTSKDNIALAEQLIGLTRVSNNQFKQIEKSHQALLKYKEASQKQLGITFMTLSNMTGDAAASSQALLNLIEALQASSMGSSFYLNAKTLSLSWQTGLAALREGRLPETLLERVELRKILEFVSSQL
ncbi:hypothetical protein HDE_09759 [Halotydeus destructor]|nr:hypothetical protein HDE_09759 [Halotydeus destructor]